MAQEIATVGGGITGPALGLALHEQGIPCRVFERPGDQPFRAFEEVILRAELQERYRQIAAHDLARGEAAADRH